MAWDKRQADLEADKQQKEFSPFIVVGSLLAATTVYRVPFSTARAMRSRRHYFAILSTSRGADAAFSARRRYRGALPRGGRARTRRVERRVLDLRRDVLAAADRL